jgi:hypothetical protein
MVSTAERSSVPNRGSTYFTVALVTVLTGNFFVMMMKMLWIGL